MGATKDKAQDHLEVAIMLSINQRLFEQGYIPEEMYHKAKELILKQSLNTA